MKRILSLLFTVIISCGTIYASDSYDVIKVYKRIEVEYGTKASNNYGNLIEIKYLYVPIELERGRYDVELNREDSNFYHIIGTDYYIETRFCYKYAIREEALLIIKSSYGYTLGEVIFYD